MRDICFGAAACIISAAFIIIVLTIRETGKYIDDIYGNDMYWGGKE